MIIYDFRRLTKSEAMKRLSCIVNNGNNSGLPYLVVMTPALFNDVNESSSFPSKLRASPRIAYPTMKLLRYDGYYVSIVLTVATKEMTCDMCNGKPYSMIRCCDNLGLPHDRVKFLCEHHHNIKALICELKKPA